MLSNTNYCLFNSLAIKANNDNYIVLGFTQQAHDDKQYIACFKYDLATTELMAIDYTLPIYDRLCDIVYSLILDGTINEFGINFNNVYVVEDIS